MEGAIIGTLSYMSPEQAQGGKVDARSDIFSYGSVFYEMLTQQRAFHGRSGLETLTAILRDEPRKFPDTADIPEDVREVVLRCLRKDPDQRFQAMSDVKAALEQLYFASRSGILQAQSGMWKKPVTKALPSIAVLPFLNLSSDKENEYFSDGLAEEIINALDAHCQPAGHGAYLGVRFSRRAGRRAQDRRNAQRRQRARRQRAQIGQSRPHQRAADRSCGRQQPVVGTL